MWVIRPERHSDEFSRGAELIEAIRDVWDKNGRISRCVPDRNAQIEANCHAVMREFDLTYPEWHHWCGIVDESNPRAGPVVGVDPPDPNGDFLPYIPMSEVPVGCVCDRRFPFIRR